MTKLSANETEKATESRQKRTQTRQFKEIILKKIYFIADCKEI